MWVLILAEGGSGGTFGFTAILPAVFEWTHDRAFLATAGGFDHRFGHYIGAIDDNTHERVGGFDWLPTFAALTDYETKPERQLEGRNVCALLTGEA